MKRKFIIPDQFELISKELVGLVVASIPSGWAVLQGGLSAPQEMLAMGDALASTKFVFATSIHPMIEKAEVGQTADIFRTLVKGNKKPGRVEFGYSFAHCEVVPMGQCKEIVAYYIHLGYRGRLTFEWRERDLLSDPPEFGCEIWLPKKPRDASPTIEVQSNSEDYLDRGGTIAPILEICEKLALLELQSLVSG